MARRAAERDGAGAAGEAPVPGPDAPGPTGFASSGGSLGIIRVVVVAATDPLPDEALPPEAMPQASVMSVETTAALARLGDPVELLRPESLPALADFASDPTVDAVVFDRVAPERLPPLLSALGETAPPSIVVVDSEAETAALDAFRAGASDCIAFGPDYENTMPVVLLEQVRRWRGSRQRAASEQHIQFLEDLNAGIVSGMPAGLVVIDRDGLILTENPEFVRLFPSRADQPAAEFLAARVPPEIAAVLDAPRPEADRPDPDEALAGGAHLEWVRVGHGAEGGSPERVYEVRHRPLPGAAGSIVMISDMTESEWLAQRLESLRRDTRDIVENINSALIVVDLAGRISFANAAAETILGGVRGDLGGRQIGDWFAADGAEENPILACLADGTRSRGAETLLQRSDGQWIPVGLSCSPRLDDEGRSHGVVAVFQDLSEIKELELQVRQTEKMASIGQLAAGVAHEVNNPMGFIHANLHQMSEYLTDLDKYFEATTRLQDAALDGDPDLVRAAAEDVKAVAREIDLEFVRSDFEKALLESGEGAERIRHIVKDLRDFSRPDLPARSPADVNQAIDSTANIVYTMMKHSVVIEKAYQALPEIEAYPMQLKQVFMNLLVNAHQAIEARQAEQAGAGDAREPERGVIRIETALEQDEIVVRIADTGVGMPEAVRSRIFEPFFTTKPVGAGTGLGLSTCFSIVERHGGRIAVESEVGRGSVFEVRLPVVHRSDVAPAASGRA